MVEQVTLGARLDTAAAPGLQDELLNTSNDDLVLDGAQVQQLGGLCLEILMVAAARRHQNDKTVSFAATSAQMVDDLARFGLTPDTLLERAV